jgi:hypothetical protein
MLLASRASADDILAEWWARSAPASAAPATNYPTAYTNLVAWYTYSSGGGDLQLDSSGYNNICTQGTASAQPTITNGYAAFDGGDWLATTNAALLNGSASNTITTWVWLDTANDYAGLATVRGTHFLGLAIDTFASGRALAYVPGAGYQNTNAYFPTGTWFFAASVFKTSAQGVCDVNGTNRAFSSGSVNWVVDDYWQIGRDESGTRRITGRLDDTRIYNRDLSTNELNSVMLEGRR